MNVFSIALPSESDRSVQILDQITGVAKYTISGNNTEILHLTFNEMLKHFNQALLGFSLIIFAILLFVGTLNTAADGQFLGRNWNSVWTPIRIVIGILFVVPVKGGLCIGQYIFLYAILVGVNIATYVWDQVVEDVFNHYTPPAIPVYVANYAQEVVENEMILTTMQSVISQIFPGGSACTASNSEDIPYIAGAYNYLRSQDISTAWQVQKGTVLGMVDVYLDQAHLDANSEQYKRIEDRVTNNAWNYIHQSAGQGAELPLESFDSCAASTAKVSTYIPIDVTYDAGSMTTSVLSLFSANADKACAQLYSDPSALANCRTAISSVISGGNNQNGQPQTGKGVYDGTTTVWLGKNVIGQGVVDSNNNFTGFPSDFKPDGKIRIVGGYNYSFDVADSQKAPTDTDASKKFQETLQSQIQAFVASKVLDVSSSGANLCSETGSCSLAAMSNTVLKQAQDTINSGCAPVEVKDLDGNPIKDTDGNPITQMQCNVSNLTTYEVNGMPYVDDQGISHAQTIEVPLEGSWWNAGEAYLIIDDRFAKNIQVLIDAIQKNMTDLSGGQSVTGKLAVQDTGIAIMMAGQIYSNGLKDDSMISNPCVPMSDYGVSGSSSMVCGLGEMRLLPPTDLGSIDFSTDKVNIADMGDTGTWGEAIGPYNPDLDKNDLMYKYRVLGAGSLYDQLLEVPIAFRAPIQLMLIQAQNGTDKNAPACAADQGNCFVTVYPYLQNLLNVLASNGLLATKNEVLPINQSMDQMFTQLLGTQDANNPRIRSINSVMQSVYNFGEDKAGDIVSQQFSLIQQVRDTGISMVVACLGSMETVYTHYRTAMDNLITSVNNEVQSPEAISAQALAGGASGLFVGAGIASGAGQNGLATALGFFGQASETTSQILQSQVELSIATTTVTTLSNIGVQLMWLPLFLFVMTSLLAAGVQFALVIPFMPYIMFWAGQMAWVIGVLEALVAAPLVMLAVAHPGGNEYVGHAAPAMRFLIGVIFRPVLMVIGLITGILLTYVLIHYSAEGFHIIAGSIFGSLPAGDDTLLGVMSCLLLFTYASFLVMAFTKCFSPIYVIPEKVVQWINGHNDRTGEQEAQQFGSNVQQTAQSGAQAGGQAMQQGIQAQQTRGQQMSDLGGKQFSQGLAMSASSKFSGSAKEGASSFMQFKAAQGKGDKNS